MTKEEKLGLLAETLEVETEELSEDTVLSDLDCWDSMTKLSLIVMFDDEFGKKITSEDIKGFSTIGDILEAME